MKLTEALRDAKESRETTDPGSMTQEYAFDALIAAVEEYLAEQKRDAEKLVGLAGLRPWGGV